MRTIEEIKRRYVEVSEIYGWPYEGKYVLLNFMSFEDAVQFIDSIDKFEHKQFALNRETIKPLILESADRLDDAINFGKGFSGMRNLANISEYAWLLDEEFYLQIDDAHIKEVSKIVRDYFKETDNV